MKLSTKGRYAMVALCDIALQKNSDLVTLADISKRQKISLAYLEQLFVKLRRADLVIAARGPGGGYKLGKTVHEIRVSDILEAVDEAASLKPLKEKDIEIILKTREEEGQRHRDKLTKLLAEDKKKAVQKKKEVIEAAGGPPVSENDNSSDESERGSISDISRLLLNFHGAA